MVKLAGLPRLAGGAVGGGTGATDAAAPAVSAGTDHTGMSAVPAIAATAAIPAGVDGAAVDGLGVAARASGAAVRAVAEDDALATVAGCPAATAVVIVTMTSRPSACAGALTSGLSPNAAITPALVPQPTTRRRLREIAIV
jgi:hypothetical protein